jgi:acyl carrier protein
MGTNDVEVIRSIVSSRTGRPISDDRTPLISGGLIDSMSIVDLILDLQQAFSITIPASEVQPDDFDTIDRIADTVSRFRPG